MENLLVLLKEVIKDKNYLETKEYVVRYKKSNIITFFKTSYLISENLTIDLIRTHNNYYIRGLIKMGIDNKVEEYKEDISKKEYKDLLDLTIFYK